MSEDLQRRRGESEQGEEGVGCPDGGRVEWIGIWDRGPTEGLCTCVFRVDGINLDKEDGHDSRVEDECGGGSEPDKSPLCKRHNDQGRGEKATDDKSDEATIMKWDTSWGVVEENLKEKVCQCKVGDESRACSVQCEEDAGDCLAYPSLPFGIATEAGACDCLDGLLASNVSAKDCPEATAHSPEDGHNDETGDAQMDAGTVKVEWSGKEDRRMKGCAEEIGSNVWNGE